MSTLLRGTEESSLLDSVVASSSLWACEDGDAVVGFLLCREGLIEAVYVAHSARRRKVATTLVRTLLASPAPPIDAYALPGDRAMKSLFESLGWKARLLTMRGA